MLKPVKRKGSPFYIARGSINGRQIERSTKTDNYATAKRRCIEIAAEIASRSDTDQNAPYTFRDAVNDYLNQGGSLRYIQKPLDHFGSVPITAINNKALYEAARILYPNAQPATVNRQLFTPVSAVIECAAGNDLCPPKRFKRPKSDNPRTRFISPVEAEAIILASHHSPNGFMPAIITFLFGQGARLKEALTMEGSDVHLDAGFAMLYPDKTKSNKQRRIVLIPRVKTALSNLPTVGQPGPLFRNMHGLPYKFTHKDYGSTSGGQISGPLDAACKRAGVERITAHECRHTWATWFYAQTRDFVRLKEEGGWAKDTMALRYTKIGTSHLGNSALNHNWDFDPIRGKSRVKRSSRNRNVVNQGGLKLVSRP